ncbi:flagellar biosynthesis repressor FlbT [Sphingomonas sp. S-NIH.Pt15_0812]|jgi:flagellar protein FlbT|uniref:flagellar biosynthesis repressor FlbT n=1 Tax=Sphingomonas sp. S-NIH.Pt15_0812 TaxID=1920129 RepID=UPI000F7E3A0E|nr:flagellar biosynthesis repressor FlbT [Sphingomonas sp. S-NIH.Pt15_0812]RSU53889.1 flagellar biosynthesis repressor FlbT [Sphingomonas sp. S-NIH.Pt15_0812]
MTLRIALRDGEKMIVNGAVLRARGRTELLIENQVSLLRAREVMHPDQATTPARRLYLATMFAYIDEPNRANHQNQVVDLLADLMSVFERPAARAACLEFARFVATNDFYRALGACRVLIDHETAVFAHIQGEAA